MTVKTILIAETQVELGGGTGNGRRWRADDVNGDDLLKLTVDDYGVAVTDSLVKVAEDAGKAVVRRTDGKPVFKLLHDLVPDHDGLGRIVITPLLAS